MYVFTTDREQTTYIAIVDGVWSGNTKPSIYLMHRTTSIIGYQWRNVITPLIFLETKIESDKIIDMSAAATSSTAEETFLLSEWIRRAIDEVDLSNLVTASPDADVVAEQDQPSQ